LRDDYTIMVHLNKVLEHFKKLLLISVRSKIFPVSLIEGPSEEIYKHHRYGSIGQHSKIPDLVRDKGVISDGQIAKGDEISDQLRGLIVTEHRDGRQDSRQTAISIYLVNRAEGEEAQL
jgi:hypothetical protein